MWFSSHCVMCIWWELPSSMLEKLFSYQCRVPLGTVGSFSLYTRYLFWHKQKAQRKFSKNKGRWGEHNIKKVPAPKNSEKRTRSHYCRSVFILQLAHYFAKKPKESNKLFILSKQIIQDLGTNKNIAEGLGGSNVETY